MDAETITYEELLGVTNLVNPANYKKRFKAIAKNSAGIPLNLEGEAERRGRIFADLYETLYDNRKQSLRDADISFSELVRDDKGNLLTINLAACLSVPVFMQALERGDGALFAVIVVHWMRASKEHEWVFSHLCEAVHAYFSLEELRDELGSAVEYAFDDLRDHLREALYQFNHRHC